MNGLVLPTMVELGLVTSQKVVKNDRPPLPSELVSVFIVFGGAALLNAWDPRIGTGFAWGIVLATALNLLPEIVSAERTA